MLRDWLPPPATLAQVSLLPSCWSPAWGPGVSAQAEEHGFSFPIFRYNQWQSYWWIHKQDPVTSSYTHCHRQDSVFNSTYIEDSHKTQAQSSLLLLLGWQRKELTSAGTQAILSRFTNTHRFVVASSTDKAPLSAWHTCQHPGPC